MNHSAIRIRAAATALLVAAGAACQAGDVGGPGLDTGDLDATLFFTQEDPQGMMMQALFEGKINRDEAGCLRAESLGEHPTVVWPAGYTIEASHGMLLVRDAERRVVGRVGGTFSIGGGISTIAHSGVSDAERQLAETRCPGEVWIASTEWHAR